MNRHVVVLAAMLLVATQANAQRFEPTASAGTRWFKGNTHSHTINTDGDSPPDTVVQWYRTHGYNFLVISDHDTITEPATLSRYQDSAFILVRGEEVTGRFQTKPVHLTAIRLRQIVKPRTGASLLETLQSNVDAIREAGGIPLINHPNYRWALNYDVLQQVQRVALFELFNGHPQVHNDGGDGVPSTEAQWDALLSAGKRIYGVASDDAHHWKQWGRASVNPDRGWIYVRAQRLDPDELARALEAGQFYASTGVELTDVIVSQNTIEIRVKQDRDFKYVTEFMGNGGRVLARAHGTTARYELKDSVSYVRARIIDSGGRRAWVQPVFVN
ncbi:MAG: CehA/McbA family metallohydrolase [Longimicrobiales bacterium]